MSNVSYNIDDKRTKRLGFMPVKGSDGQYLFGGATPCSVTGIELVDTEYKEGEFADLNVKSIKFDFEQVKLEADDPDRFITIYVRMPGSLKYKDKYNHMAGMKPIPDEDLTKIVKGVLDWIFHLHDAFIHSSNYKPIGQLPKKTLTALGKIKANNSIDVKERVEFWNTLFTDIVNFMNGDGKPVYTMKDGSPCEIWAKVMPNYSSEPKFNQTYYTISNYIEKGIFEPLRRKEDGSLIKPKILVIDLTRLPLKSGRPAAQINPAGVAQEPGAININDIMASS